MRFEGRHEVNEKIDHRPLLDQNGDQHQRGVRQAFTTGCVQFLLTSPYPTSRISSNSSRHRDVSEARQHQFCPVRDRRLWEAIPSVPDLQCAWQILVQSANPRSNHTIRTLPLAVCRIRPTTRRRHVGHSASSAHGSPWLRTRVEKRRTRSDTPHAHGWSGDEVRTLVRSRRVLGFVVKRPSHDPPTHTCSG